jgi:hypothetical protein
MIGLLIFFASPTASHALARAALLRGLGAQVGPPARTGRLTHHRNPDHRRAADA